MGNGAFGIWLSADNNQGSLAVSSAPPCYSSHDKTMGQVSPSHIHARIPVTSAPEHHFSWISSRAHSNSARRSYNSYYLENYLTGLQWGTHSFWQEVKPGKLLCIHLLLFDPKSLSPVAICHCRKERENEWKQEILNFRKKYFPMKHDKYFWFEKRERKGKTFPTRTILHKRFEVVMQQKEQDLHRGPSCLNAGLKSSQRTWTQRPRL